MTVARERRRRRRLTPRPASLLEPGELTPIRSWAGTTLSVQLPSERLASGRLPSLAVGDVRDLVPIFHLAWYVPLPDVTTQDAWCCGEAGTCEARGVVLPPLDDDHDAPSYVLDVAGRLFPLDWTNPEPFGSPVIEASGGLYLDPCVDPGGPFATTGLRCRSSLRVAALRRYDRRDGEPRDPEPLDRSPDPWDVRESSSYVVDLEVVENAT